MVKIIFNKRRFFRLLLRFVNHVTAFTGYLPDAVSPESITASVPSIIRICDIRCFGPCGYGIFAHGFQHLGGSYNRFVCLDCLVDNMFLYCRNLFRFHSTPRSPLATIIASATFKISSRFSTASGFSILAMTGISTPCFL